MKKLNLTKLIIGLLMITSILILNPIGANAEWKMSDGQWHYTEGNSYAKGWRNINGNWYYFSYEDGSIISGGIDNVDGKIYYFDNNGAMKTGWIYLNNTGTQYVGWHYFYGDGSMAKDTTVNGYYLNDYGTWVNNQSMKDQIKGTWNINFINGSGGNMTITDTKIGNYPYTIIEERTDNIIVEVNEDNVIVKYMIKVNGNTIVLYMYNDGSYTEVGEGSKVN